MAGRPPRTDEQVAFDKRMGERLRHFRESRGKEWTQERMAEEIGVSAAAYIKWEQRGPIPPFYVAKIALMFAVNPWTLLTGLPSFRKSLEETSVGKLGIFGVKSVRATKRHQKRHAA